MVEALPAAVGLLAPGTAVFRQPPELAEGWNHTWGTASHPGKPWVEPSPHLPALYLELPATILIPIPTHVGNTIKYHWQQSENHCATLGTDLITV